MPRHKGIWGVEWDWCDRCGFEHPITSLVMQRGRKLCKCHGCLDDLSNDERQRIISDSMRNSQEGVSDKTAIFRDPGEIVF